MANSRQSATIFSPSSKRPTKRTRSSITEHSFQGIASSPRGGSVTYVSGTNCHPCVGSLKNPNKLEYYDVGVLEVYFEEVTDSAQGIGISFRRIECSQNDGVIGSHACGLVHRMGVAPLQQDILFGAYDEECRAECEHE